MYAGYVACIGAMRDVCKVLRLEELKERDCVEDQGIDGWLILKLM